MSPLAAAAKKVWGLFVDDAGLALVVWCAIAGLVLPRFPVVAGREAPLLAAGCVLIMIVNVASAARRRRV